MRPSPPQVSQACSRTSWPNAVRVTARILPAPLHVGQVSIGVPGSAPFPWQCSHTSTSSYATSTVLPAAASASEISTSTARSPPWMRPAPPRPKAPPNGSPPKNASKMSAKEPKPCACELNPRESSPSKP